MPRPYPATRSVVYHPRGHASPGVIHANTVVVCINRAGRDTRRRRARNLRGGTRFQLLGGTSRTTTCHQPRGGAPGCGRGMASPGVIHANTVVVCINRAGRDTRRRRARSLRGGTRFQLLGGTSRTITRHQPRGGAPGCGRGAASSTIPEAMPRPESFMPTPSLCVSTGLGGTPVGVAHGIFAVELVFNCSEARQGRQRAITYRSNHASVRDHFWYPGSGGHGSSVDYRSKPRHRQGACTAVRRSRR